MPLYWIALNAVKGLGPVRIKHLLSHFDSPETIFGKSSSALRKTGLFSEESIRQIHDPDLLSYAEEQLNLAQTHNIRTFTLNEKDYPQILREIFAPPPVLFAKGHFEVFSKHGIAVVGMRQPGTYGRNATPYIVEGLTKHNIAIISGLALGIDSIAHKACLEHGGSTIAVLGSGIDKIYPAANRNLAEQIEAGGAVISEFPLGTPPLPYNFPRRNRVISGLSAGVLVVEAGKKSGSLITAHYALQQGRDVFAVPGSIFSDKSYGTFNLIRNGAIPVQSAQDILDNIELVVHSCSKPEIVSKATQLPLELLNSEERLIIDTLSDTPMRLDQIAEKIQKTVADLFSILLNLELKGIVQQVAGQQYVRI